MNQMHRSRIYFVCLSAVLLLCASTVQAAVPVVESAKFTNPNTVTIFYSEPVRSTLGDYNNFTGDLVGTRPVSLSGSGTNAIILTFGGSVGYNALGGVTISSSVTSVSDGSPIAGAHYFITDGQAPLISSMSVSSDLYNGTFARRDNRISVSFYGNEPIRNPVITIANNAIIADGFSNGPYSATYKLSPSDTQDIVPVSIAFNDLAGNRGGGSFVFGGGIAPRIISITSDATSPGSLGAGSTVNFVATLASPTPNAYVSGSYNGVSLSWRSSDGGGTYTGSYTVRNDDAPTGAPLQISDVTIRDTSGTLSAPASGYDVQKTIDPKSLAISQNPPVTAPVASDTATVTQTAPVSNAAASTASSYKFSLSLNIGSTGTEVIKLQERLAAEKIYTGPISGYYGALTAAAVKKYQELHGVSQLGKVGPATRAALNGGM